MYYDLYFNHFFHIKYISIKQPQDTNSGPLYFRNIFEGIVI